ncbi:MAG: biosynthetic arginine decarboxylase [Candidatus Eisenbacteria bacterium]
MDATYRISIPVLYGIENWGSGYFDVNAAGHLMVKPFRSGPGVDLFQVVEELRKRRCPTPVLLRFPQVLETQIRHLHQAFQSAITEFQYGARYQGVFPMKVNHRRDVVEELLRVGSRYDFGIEVGSKAELYIALSIPQPEDSLLICNGFKDDSFIEMAFWGLKTGKRVVIVIEQVREMYAILKRIEETGLVPTLGLRGRLYTRGSGKWEESGGETSKFGLSTVEMIDCLRILQGRGLEGALKMLHFHIGSQITDIRRIKAAVKEASRVYSKIRKMKVPVEYLNVGGGLGVDYDGSKTPSDSSANYTVQEFANDVVYTIREICDAEDVPVPTIVSESGRAVTVYHSMLIVSAENRSDASTLTRNEMISAESDNQVLRELFEIARDISVKNFREYYHDALQQREELFTLFDLGYIDLLERGRGEALFEEICTRALRFAKQTNYVSDEFDLLEKALRKKYVANFSVFQSVPDSWSIGQLFPVLPIHRLNEFPTENGILVDLTCDSDGQIDSFVDVKDIKEILELHPTVNGGPYYIAITLLGAYQDVMGDFHNLFGSVNEAHVVVDENGRHHIRKILRGNSIEEMARIAGFEIEDLQKEFSFRIATGVRQGRMSEAEGASLLEAYRTRARESTYLSPYPPAAEQPAAPSNGNFRQAEA